MSGAPNAKKSKETTATAHEKKVFMGAIYRLYHKKLIDIDVVLQHREFMPPRERRLLEEQQQLLNKKPKGTVESDKYYQLPSNISILTVKEDKQLEQMIDLLKLAETIGVDTESNIYTYEVELLQIATDKDCFLIRKKHVGQLNENLIRQLGEVVSHKKMVFFAMHNDASQMSKFIPNVKITQTLDIQILVAQLGFTVLMANNQPKPTVSLSDCVEHWLKKSLNKNCTMSWWGRTDELSHNQTVYAALDAWVLLKLLSAIEKDEDYANQRPGDMIASAFENAEKCKRKSKRKQSHTLYLSV